MATASEARALNSPKAQTITTTTCILTYTYVHMWSNLQNSSTVDSRQLTSTRLSARGPRN